MRRDKNIRQIALQISIALSAGVFSIMPSAAAAPVLDHVVSGAAVVDQKTNPQVTDVTSTTRNNVIDWKDFSVSQGETVRFDGGAKTNNYLNVVSGVNTSHIDGAIKGGDNVYIVNPNGVVFGNSASVDVGSLYVSSRPLDAVNYEKVDANGDMQPLADTASMSGGDIVNMGTVQANSVFLEGGNIVIGDIDKVKTTNSSVDNNHVTIQTEGKITLAQDINTSLVEEKSTAAKVFSFANATEFTFGNAVTTAESINDKGGWLTFTEKVNNGQTLASDYVLSTDLDFSGDDSYTPVGNESHAFNKNFDGQYHTISGIKVSGVQYGGLFGYTLGGTIENIGVSVVKKDDGSLVGSVTAAYAGGIAGQSVGTKFEHVFNEGIPITGTDAYTGGLVGSFDGGSITTAYNTGNVSDGDSTSIYVGGIVGFTQDGATLSEVYNTGNVVNGLVGWGEIKSISNAYTTVDNIGGSGYSYAEEPTNVVIGVKETWKSKDDYTGLSSISTQGGVNTTWRIYEGQSLPLLRDFLKAHGTVTVSYHYTQGAESGYNTDTKQVDGTTTDLTVKYNHNNIVLDNVTYEGYQYVEKDKYDYGNGTKYDGIILSGTTDQKKAITVDEDLINAPASIDGNVVGLDSNKKGLMKAAFYTGQQGYDLIGNNVTINPRTVNIDASTISGNPITKVYDGTASATEAAASLSYGEASGIITGDNTVSIDSTNVSAAFQDSYDGANDAADVGAGKIVKISGSIELNNADGYYNYILSDASVTLPELTIEGNSITQKAVTVALKTKTGIEKGYNGSALVEGASFVPGAQIASTLAGVSTGTGTDTVSQTLNIAKDDNAYYVVGENDTHSKAADTYTNKVKYGGIKITGVSNGKTKNYKLVNEAGDTIYSEYVAGLTGTGVNEDTGGSLYGSGKITKKKLSNQDFSWLFDGSTPKTVERQYNNSSAYDEPVGSTVDSAETLAINDDMTFTVTSAKFMAAASESAAEVKNAGDNYFVGYTVTVTGEDVVNYTFGDNDEAIGSSVTLFGSGKITPRTIKIGVDSSKSADKMYDATTIVLDNDNAESFVISEKAADNVQFNDGTSSYHLLEYTGGADYKLLDDGAEIVYSGVYKQKNSEGDANVNFDGAQVADKNITYTATIKGGNGNYVFDNSTATDTENNPQITLNNGVGKITQREISNLYFTDVTKEYDTTADVNHDDIALNVGTGDNQVKLYGEDTAETVFDLTNVTGVYKAVAAGKKDADAENGKDVIYSGISGILKNNNYKLGSNIGSTATGKGSITQATLNDMSKLTFDVSGVTKVYDGDADIKGAGHTSTDNNSEAFIGTDGLVYTLNGNPVSLNYSVHDAYYDSAESNNATAQGITYELSVSGDSTGNYTIGSNLLTGGYLKWASTVNGWTDAEKAKMTGVITKKDLVVTPLHNLVTKVYDGGTAVMVGTTTLENDTAVSFAGWIDVTGRTKTATANYTDKNVDSADETAAGGKTVNYVITLDSTSQGNYTLKDAQGTTLTNNTLTGKGHITPATLTITFTPNPVTKTYDGEKSFTGEVTPVYDGIVTNDKVGLKKFTIDAGERYYSAAEFDTADKGTDKDVYYTVELEGVDKGNYVLANSEIVDGVTIMTGKGTISPKQLSDADIKISFADIISKVYDATDAVAFDHTGDERYFASELGTISATAESYVNSLTVGGVTLTLGDSGDYKVYSANYNSAGVDANKATYVFTLQGDKLDNFDMTNLSSTLYDPTNKRLTLATDSTTNTINTTSVSITPKLLQASLNETVLDLNRTYNGTANLPVSPADAASKVTVTGFVNDNGDTTALDKSLVNGRYVDRNVAYDADGNVTTKDVLFDVKLKGTGAENYVINDTNANSTTLTGENLGKITPKELLVDFDYTEKTYNNNPDAVVKGVTLTGRQTGDTALNLDTATIEAQFGSKNGDTFTANGDVNYDESAEGKAGFKGVQYSNLQNAMLVGFGEDGTGYKIAKNYTIADTVYFNEAAQKGKIKRLALTQENIKTKWDTVTKEYDGTDAAPTGKLHIYTDVLGTSEDKLVDLNYVLKNTNGAVYDNQQVNVVSGHGVTYTLNGLEAKEFHNFEMTQALMDSFNNKTYTTTGAITPRVLSINIKNPDNWVKVYDGTTAIKDANGAVVNNFDFNYKTDHNILEDDANTVKLAVTGAYGDSNANIEPDSQETTGKTIKYTLTLTGNTAGNYTLDSTAHPAKGAENETDSTTYTGDGAIKKRIVYAAFDDGFGTGIDRYYKGANDTSADADKTVRNHINLVASTGGNTGLLDGDTAVTLDKDNISANYASANVARNPQTKQVTTQDVYFTNFNLQGTGSGNYVVKVNDANNPNTLVGKGTIKPIEVTVGLKAVPTKEYDGTTDIKATYLANDNFNFTQDPNNAVVSENVANDITITGAYKNANAGSKDANYADKEYTYSLTLNNGNYELVSGEDNGRTVTAANYGMKATLAGADGIIEPRTISLDSIADMTKVYDGTTDADTGYMKNLEKNITFNNVVNNESLKLTGTAEYTDDANASDENDDPKKHQVKYTLNIGNTNYRLNGDTQELTGYGDGYINRRSLLITAKPVSINAGEAMPQFSGTVTGFVNGEQSAYSDFVQAISSGFKAADNASNTTPGSYGVYGWYMGSRTGMLGLNYTFDQAPANNTAFTVNYVNNNSGNPDTKITPNNNIYNQISKDMNSGFGDNGAAAIEYKDKSGKVLGTENIDSGEINGKGLTIGGTDMSKQADSNAHIGIAGGDIVNMEGANAAGSVNVETSGEGTVVNLEVFSIGEDTQSGDKDSVAEITNTTDKTYSLELDNSTEGEIAIKNTNDSIGAGGSIAITNEKQNILGEEVKDKKEDKEKEGEIAIKSSNGDDDDEIELTVEKEGVNVA